MVLWFSKIFRYMYSPVKILNGIESQVVGEKGITVQEHS